jgi:TorA maturation chaperone TorD
LTEPLAPALRILSHFWLEELRTDDLPLLQALPELAETLPQTGVDELTDLSAEYQRLFGFNLPPYESVFIDPSAMLMAPATERVQQLYRQVGWTPPPETRTGGPDHLGLELLALADWLEQGQSELATRLQTGHLALWAPVFILTLRRLDPHPFYTRLAELTLDLMLATLPARPLPPDADPFPDLPLPPKFRGTEENWPPAEFDPEEGEPDQLVPLSLRDDSQESIPGLRSVLNRLLAPRQAGLYLTRQDIARLGHRLDLPGAMGDRYRMLETLFRSARQYELLPSLVGQLSGLIEQTEADYAALADEYPAWGVYAGAWQNRLRASQTVLTDLAKPLQSPQTS